MRKFFVILFLGFLLTSNTQASSKWGKGELKLRDYVVEQFIKYLRGNSTRAPDLFAVSVDGRGYIYSYCSAAAACRGGTEQILKRCSSRSNGEECYLFAKRRTIKWKNGINPGKGKASKISGKWSDTEIRARLTELGFLGSKTTSSSSANTITKKKETKKIVKKYELKGERSIALSWDGYEELIAGTVEFDETDYKGTLNLPLPNNDGTCDGTYSLQEGGKGTWQIACTNNMGAAGTLKWNKNGGVTGLGRDHNDKRVKFTVSKKS
ncbi:hypothetical protein N9780_03075 [Candidatus Pelagibacter sp.]|jgi:hypothetical protein|nr:hypothetical protein [Candidatus Pelagibacter sp.]